MDKFLSVSNFFVCCAIALLCQSCDKNGPCFDVESNNHWINEVKAWQDTTIGTNRNMVDSWAIDEMLILKNPYEWRVAGSVYDYCDKAFDYYQYSATYSTSLFNYGFEITFKVEPQALFPDFERLPEEYVTLTIEYRHPTVQSKGTYSLSHNASLMASAETFIRHQQTINGVAYAEVLEINFLNCSNPAGISQINYAKGAGIVSFTTCAGNTFALK